MLTNKIYKFFISVDDTTHTSLIRKLVTYLKHEASSFDIDLLTIISSNDAYRDLEEICRLTEQAQSYFFIAFRGFNRLVDKSVFRHDCCEHIFDDFCSPFLLISILENLVFDPFICHPSCISNRNSVVLPPSIDSDVFEERLQASPSHLQQLMMRLYKLDDTSTVPSYVVAPIHFVDQEMKEVLTVLEGYYFNKTKYPTLRVGDSVQDWLLQHAVAMSQKSRDANSEGNLASHDNRCEDIIVMQLAGQEVGF